MPLAESDSVYELVDWLYFQPVSQCMLFPRPVLNLLKDYGLLFLLLRHFTSYLDDYYDKTIILVLLFKILVGDSVI